jgi:transposase
VDIIRKADTMARMGSDNIGRRVRRQLSQEFRAGPVRLMLDEGKTMAAVARELELTRRPWACGSDARKPIGRRGAPDSRTEERAELADVLAYRHLPIEHEQELHSTSPLERLNKEIKRRSNIVGDGHASGRYDPGGARRRMDRGRAAILRCGVDYAADDPDALDDGAGDFGSDRVTEEGGVGPL